MRMYSLGAAITVLSIMSFTGVLSAASDVEVWVGAPAAGHWPDACDGKSFFPTNECSQPYVHWDFGNKGSGLGKNDGDWATDLGIAAESDVFLYVAPELSKYDNRILAKVGSVRDACKSGRDGGKVIRIGIFVDDYTKKNKIGVITYAHLENLSVKKGDKISRWETKLGEVFYTTSINKLCWTGPHIHFGMYNQINYSCFNSTYDPKENFDNTNFLGFLGGNRVLGPRQGCP